MGVLSSVNENNMLEGVMDQGFKDLQKNVYEGLAVSFDRQQRRENRNHINKIKAISDCLAIEAGDVVLEIGVGTGIHADYLLQLNPVDFVFYGVDYSAAMLQQAQRRLNGNRLVHLCAMDGEHLAFPDECFDKVFISGSLHHFLSPEVGVQELLRVLKKGGRFCIMEPNYFFPTNLRAAHSLPEERNMRFITKRNLQKWLSSFSCNYEICNFAYTPPHPERLLPLFDVLDKVIGQIPLLKRLSVMLFVAGKKG